MINNNTYKGFVVLERIPKAPAYIFSLADSSFVNTFFIEKFKIKNVPGVHLNIYDGEDFLFCYNLDSLRGCTEEFFDKLIANPKWGIELDDLIIKKAKEFIEYSKELENRELENLEDEELIKISNTWFFKYFHDSWVTGWPAVLIDFEKNLFSNHLLNYLKQKVKKINYQISVGDIFSALTTPVEETFAQMETISLFNLLEKIKKDKKLVILLKDGSVGEIVNKWTEVNKDLWQDFLLHYKNYCWMPFMYTGPAWGREYFLDSIIHLLKQDINPTQELSQIAKRKKQVQELHNKYIKELDIHEQHQVLFDVARRFVFSKSYRKDAMYHGCYAIDKVLREISKRKYITIGQIRRVYPWEIEEFVKNDKPNVEVLNKRKYAVQMSDKDGRITIEGEEARNFIQDKVQFVEQKLETPKEFLGDCASVGNVRGTVKIVNSPEDINKMEKGNVLVSYATSPDIMPAIKKAVAIVTDLGGIICHAAIVSRELRIPCVVGTKIATKVLKDGDVVEVDATHGIVRIINN